MKALLVFVLAAALVPFAQNQVDARIESLGPEPDVSSVWAGPVIRSISLGFSDFLADMYWLRAVQYYGRQKIDGAPQSYANLEPLLQTAALLDPRFQMVYRYGAVFLSEPQPIGAGNPKAGVKFLGKGADANPLDWKLRQEQGLFAFVYLNDPLRASDILQQASQIPDAPFWLRTLAGQVLTNGGELEAAVTMWSLILEQSAPGVLRENATAQLRVAQNRLLARRLQDQIKAFRSRGGDPNATLKELKVLGVIDTFVDLEKVPFVYINGSVFVSRDSPLWRR